MDKYGMFHCSDGGTLEMQRITRREGCCYRSVIGLSSDNDDSNLLFVAAEYVDGQSFKLAVFDGIDSDVPVGYVGVCSGCKCLMWDFGLADCAQFRSVPLEGESLGLWNRGLYAYLHLQKGEVRMREGESSPEMFYFPVIDRGERNEVRFVARVIDKSKYTFFLDGSDGMTDSTRSFLKGDVNFEDDVFVRINGLDGSGAKCNIHGFWQYLRSGESLEPFIYNGTASIGARITPIEGVDVKICMQDHNKISMSRIHSARPGFHHSAPSKGLLGDSLFDPRTGPDPILILRTKKYGP